MKFYQHNPRARFYSWKFNSHTCICNKCPPCATLFCSLLHHYSHPFIPVERKDVKEYWIFPLNFMPSILVLLNPLVYTNVLLNTGLQQSPIEYDLGISWIITLFILRHLTDSRHQWLQITNKHEWQSPYLADCMSNCFFLGFGAII